VIVGQARVSCIVHCDLFTVVAIGKKHGQGSIFVL